MKPIDQILTASALAIVIGLGLLGANWPSISGSTSPGVVIEDGAGNKLGVSGSPLFISAPGRFIGRQTFCASGCTSTGGTYTPTANTASVDVTCVGGGGAGGGAGTTAAAQTSQGGGGGSGGGARRRITSAFSGVTVTIGAGGTGVTNLAGNTGGNTTFGALLTANGGVGGSAGPGATSGAQTAGGGAGGTASTGDINIAGQAGTSVGYFSTTLTYTGRGGDTPFGFGSGGQPVAGTGTSAGTAGSGFGAGGSGGGQGVSQAGTVAGGAGSGGICIVNEYS